MIKNILIVLSICAVLFLPSQVSAQVIDGAPYDSSIVHFTSDTMANFIPDTTAIPLWQIGHSHKSFFNIDSAGAITMMTDTLNPYPVNANNWFVIKIAQGINTIVDFWHKYQTDNTHAGGTVEFSFDYGTTWQNVKGPCNMDNTFMDFGGILTTNFYSANDTLNSGIPSFTGEIDSTKYSRFQFMGPPPERTSSGSSSCFSGDTIYVRFRFLSDSTVDSLAGWIIDSIKIEHDIYQGAVAKIIKPTLNVYPSPSYDGNFHFPQLYNEENYKLDVYNIIGVQILSVPYTHTLNISRYPAGLYYYKVTDGVDYYTGKLLTE